MSTKETLPREWQIFREANSDGQWSKWHLNTLGKDLSPHDYREIAHVRVVDPLVDEQLTEQNKTLRTRLDAAEKELERVKDDAKVNELHLMVAVARIEQFIRTEGCE